MTRYKKQREILKSNFNTFKDIKTDKEKGLPKPPGHKPCQANLKSIKLPNVNQRIIKKGCTNL